ncbi:MAG TPA: HAD-IIB family hydrolase [Candidatus Bathyarchaeia archaeon]
MNPKTTKIIIFADLDGSLLNDKYEYDQIEPIIQQLLSSKVSIVLASSKTKNEIEFYRKKLKITDPFIIENGSAILIPQTYFTIKYEFTKQIQGYNIIELGTAYSIIREKLEFVKKRTSANIMGFADMTAQEIAKDSGLPIYLAQLAKKREYSEPFKILSGVEKEVLEAINEAGLCVTFGGRYLTALGNCDKGKATSILKNLYVQQFKTIYCIGVGDSANDLTMLKNVDKPFFVKKTDNKKELWKEIESIAQTQQKNQN